MGEDRFDSLKDEHRQCLRLVAQGYSSKEIARPLGLHPRTIDQRLDRARKLLGERDRAAAARAFARHEAGGRRYDAVIYDPPAVVPQPPESEDATTAWGPAPTPVPDIVREAPASVSYGSEFTPPDAPAGGKRNGLSPLLRLTLIVLMVVGLMLAIVAAPSLYDSSQRVANAIEPPK